MNTTRRLIRFSGSFLLLLALGVGCNTTSPAAKSTTAIPAVDLGRIPDGTYPGQAVHRGFTYKVSTTVQDHRIVGVQVLSNKNSRHGRKAEGVIPLIVAQQTPGVDGISGATYCSTGLKLAVADALQKAVPGEASP